MKKIKILFTVLASGFIFHNAIAQGEADANMAEMSTHLMFNQTDLQWGAAPPSLPAGAMLTVLEGDPSKAEPFAVRLKFPAGYKIAAHWHPTTENVTVMEGTLYMGAGQKLDETKVKVINTGGFASIPAKSSHYVFTKEGCTVQIHAMGPFVINYINPADDPSKK